MEMVHDRESNCAELARQGHIQDNKGDKFSPDLKAAMNKMPSDGQEMDGEVHTLERSYNGSANGVLHVNEGKLIKNLFDRENDDLDEQRHTKESCPDFQNSIVVNTIDSELPSGNKEDESYVSASKWPDHDEALPLWVKWRGKWQAGIKCERADWPLATVKAKPTHRRKNYIVIFFPHTRNYSWADTMLVCSIDEIPQPIAHQSHKVGAQLVEDLTVARRFIMNKLIIGMLNIIDLLPVQVLIESARDLAVWREFAAVASRCKGYQDLGRLLIKLSNMLLQTYMDANWLQYSSPPWLEKCQNAVSAESVELLKEELVDSILWNEVNTIQDAQGLLPLGSAWKVWKHETMKHFSTAHTMSVGGDIRQMKNGIEKQSTDSPFMTNLQMSRKRPKLEVRRAETHSSLVNNKSSKDNTVLDIDSAFFTGRSSVVANNAVASASKEDMSTPGTAAIASPSSVVNTWERGVVAVSNAESQSNDVDFTPMNGMVETDSVASRGKSRQCTAFIEAKGRNCARWANDGDDYCCVHLASRFSGKPVIADVTPGDTSMCQGTTTLGMRCKHRSLLGTSYCKKHRPPGDGLKSFSPTGSQLKYDEPLHNPEHKPSGEIVVFRDAQSPSIENPVAFSEENNCAGGNSLLLMPQDSFEDSKTKSTSMTHCIGLSLQEGSSQCLEIPKKHSLYCDKHIPIWLKRARNGKSRIISKEVFVDLLRSCSSQEQKLNLHQACELFYKFFKSILSVRNQVPKEIQLQWALSEANKDFRVAELLLKLVSLEKERLRRIWGFDVNEDVQGSSFPVVEQAIVPVEEESDSGGTLKCKICSEEFKDDQTLGTHWIDNHNKEAQWLFRGYACAICLDSFTNKKVLETHVQERHHAQFVEHCMLIQCIPCGSHFGNSEDLWSHVLSVHTDGFRQSKTVKHGHLTVNSQPKPVPSNPTSAENKSENQSIVRKYICRFCGLRFDLLPDLGRHHQAAHMGPSLLSSRPSKKGLRLYAYKLKSGRLSRPRFKKGISASSYRLQNKASLVLKKRIPPTNSLGPGGINLQPHVVNNASFVKLTESQCSTIAKMLSNEAWETKPRPNNHDILVAARSTCCKFSLQKTLEQKFGVLPERFYLKAAKLCSDHNMEVEWHQDAFQCPKGCKPPEDPSLGPIMPLPLRECAGNSTPSEDPMQEEWEMDECHYVINSCHFRRKPLQITIILCDDISFGREPVPVPCTVDKNLIDSLHTPTYSFDGQVVFMPWESFTYATKPLLDQHTGVNKQNFQLGCECAQSSCSPETCDHVYLFNIDHENAKDIYGKPMEGRFPYDDKGRLILEDGGLVYECNHLCKCSKSCPNRVLQNGMKMKLEVFKTEKKGWGVRASEAISRGTFVCEFVGEVMELQEANRRRKRYAKKDCSYFYDVSKQMQHISEFMEGEVKYVIDATKYGNVSRFINHSCSPNLVSHLVLIESMDFQLAHIGLFAKEDIEPGEELTYTYHYELQRGEGCPCLCEASTCRGRLH